MVYELRKNTKIYVAGHKGLIGSAFIRNFKKNGYTNIITQNRNELDLTSKKNVNQFFQENHPEVVILAAGMVGGIIKNRDFPADFISKNLSIQLNVFNTAKEYDCKKLIFFASSCMYPRDAAQPMKEDQLLSGYLEPTSIAYAIAKYAGVQMCKAINNQHNSVSFIPVIPNSVYGFNDNFSVNGSHVLSALIRRFHEAKKNKITSVKLWGTGTPRREFIFSEDVVEACLVILKAHITNNLLPINIALALN